MDAYVFYCSGCRRDHAGECPPAPGVSRAPSDTALPAVGTRWAMEIRDIGGAWTRTAMVWEVLGYVEPQCERVRMRPGTLGDEYTYPAEAWRTWSPSRLGSPAGHTRMVPA